MAFDPAPPDLLQASAPPHISRPPATAAIMPRTAMPPTAIPRLAIPTICRAPTHAVLARFRSRPVIYGSSFATSAPTAAPIPPPALPHPALNTISPQLIAPSPSSVQRSEQLRPPPLALKVSPPEIASRPPAPLAPPTQTPPQFAPQLEASTQIAPPVAAAVVLLRPAVTAPPVFAPAVTAPPVTIQPSAPITAPASPTIAASPSRPAAIRAHNSASTSPHRSAATPRVGNPIRCHAACALHYSSASVPA